MTVDDDDILLPTDILQAPDADDLEEEAEE
jgi:hypothetical protein